MCRFAGDGGPQHSSAMPHRRQQAGGRQQARQQAPGQGRPALRERLRGQAGQQAGGLLRLAMLQQRLGDLRAQQRRVAPPPAAPVAQRRAAAQLQPQRLRRGRASVSQRDSLVFQQACLR